MRPLIVAAAFSLALLAVTAAAQDRSAPSPGNGPGAGTGSGVDTGTGVGTGLMSDPSERMRPETERRRSFDRQRGASPMTDDPRLGPGVGGSPGAPGTSGSGTSR